MQTEEERAFSVPGYEMSDKERAEALLIARVVDGRAEGAAELREGRGAPLLASSALRAPEGRVGVHEERRVGLGKEVEYERGQLGEKCLEEEEALVELRACHEGV
jgi:hypothetical protein